MIARCWPLLFLVVAAACQAPAGTADVSVAAKIPRTEAGFPLASSPASPFRAWTSRQGPIAVGRDHSFQVTVQPRQACSQVEVTLRGLDGVQVHGGERVSLGRLNPGEQRPRSAALRVSSGVAGYVAVDLACRDALGRLQGTSLVFPASAQGAAYRTRQLGRIEKAANGERIVVLPATQR